MNQRVSIHPKEEKLEAFLMERLPAQIAGSIYDASVVEIEEHLMVCGSCLEQAELQDWIAVAVRNQGAERMRAVAREAYGPH